jgi:radial spoke head protein 9
LITNRCRFQIDLALQQLLNNSAATDFEELLFWGRISAAKCDYYIALGLQYSDRYEFPEKKFYWCNAANGMVFTPFPALNSQHASSDKTPSEYNLRANDPFTGEPMKVLKAVE